MLQSPVGFVATPLSPDHEWSGYLMEAPFGAVVMGLLPIPLIATASSGSIFSQIEGRRDSYSYVWAAEPPKHTTSGFPVPHVVGGRRCNVWAHGRAPLRQHVTRLCPYSGGPVAVAPNGASIT